MSTRLSGNLAGSIRWAIAPYAPSPPFRIYAADHAPYRLDDARQLIDASKKGGDAEFIYLIPAKARPLLILSNPVRSEWQEVVALWLRRLSKISDQDDQERIRQQREPLYFYLDPARVKLPEENAVLIPALVTINAAAISSDPPLGTLSENEMRFVGERLVRHFDFDVRSLVERRIRELARRHRERGS